MILFYELPIITLNIYDITGLQLTMEEVYVLQYTHTHTYDMHTHITHTHI